MSCPITKETEVTYTVNYNSLIECRFPQFRTQLSASPGGATEHEFTLRYVLLAARAPVALVVPQFQWRRRTGQKVVQLACTLADLCFLDFRRFFGVKEFLFGRQLTTDFSE